MRHFFENEREYPFSWKDFIVKREKEQNDLHKPTMRPSQFHSALATGVVYPFLLDISFRNIYYQNIGQCRECQLLSNGFIHQLPSTVLLGVPIL